MKIILCDLQPKLVIEWIKVFQDCPNVVPIQHDILKVVNRADAICSPSNSFGFLTGGIDGVYARYFGPYLQIALQSEIKRLRTLELPVGMAVAVPTGNSVFPNLIAAPTMRVPMDISKKINVYLAFKAILGIAKFYDFETIVCPGLGTATDRVSASLCAKQMHQAYIDHASNYFPVTLEEAMNHHLRLTEN